jgi:hypothetical protein
MLRPPSAELGNSLRAAVQSKRRRSGALSGLFGAHRGACWPRFTIVGRAAGVIRNIQLEAAQFAEELHEFVARLRQRNT